MATTITAGNATNGLALSADNTGILQLKTGTGSGTTALTLDASQVATFAGNVSGVIKSGTAVASTSGTSITFTGIPSTVKRVTVMFSGVSTNGTSAFLVQIGSGSVTNTGYVSTGNTVNNSSASSGASSTAGFLIQHSSASTVLSGQMTITLMGSNLYVSSHSGKISTTNIVGGGGDVTLSDTLDRVRITTVNGTDAFDAGTVNILWE